MPIFEYMCKECGGFFEHLQLGAAHKGVQCPKCKSSHVEKRFSAFTTPKGGAYCPSSCQAGGDCSGSSGRKCFEYK